MFLKIGLFEQLRSEVNPPPDKQPQGATVLPIRGNTRSLTTASEPEPRPRIRPIAVVGGEPTARMAHHGYTRPGHGWQTASCPGTKFMPLDTTDDGPRYMLAMRIDQRRRTEAALAQCPDLTELSVLVRERGVETLKKITRDMPEWKRAYDAHVWDIESDLRGLKSEINRLRRIVLDWRPETDVQLDPNLADAHFNAGRLHDELGNSQGAIRHYSAYRRLSR
ncbi:hypothetical protein [Variovorax ginsengisoli]|uniref:Tetratricopeptide repeat protein n=1 Tax=Variovorax ginsengisoli TaxID=363844 RepID=A0ABT8SE31_9BURK|nr:hypothetical protein [Variovorax ginsengisoli]MDN8617994.1 hypothetical protein [Variovorax ginsengisoli]MDO1537164.1 hypothetical protein [Variovorax ginsengisoli]